METFDAVIIGSGFGGSVAAARLAGDGRSTLLLERGRSYGAADFRQSYDVFNMSRFYRAYSTRDYKVFFRTANLLGGGTEIFSGACLRSPSEAFDFVEDGGYRAWPAGIDRAVMDPYYERAEVMMQVSRARWEEVPKVGAIFARMLASMGLTCDRSRYNYVDCLQCGFCETGCIFGRKKGATFNYIPEARRQGCRVRTGCEAVAVKAEGGGYRVVYRDARGRECMVFGRLVVLAANAIETPAILLRSRPHLPRLNDQVGRNFNQNGDVGFAMELASPVSGYKIYMGRTNAGVITYAFWKEHRITIHPGAPPPAIFAGLDVHRPGGKTFGLEAKRLAMSLYPDRMLAGLVIGMIPGYGRITLRRDRPSIDFPLTKGLKAYLVRVESVLREIARAGGARLLYTDGSGFERGDAHPLASCRIGDDPARSACDPTGQVWDCPGLYVADASAVPCGTGVNPALTVAANAERISDGIIADVRR